MVGVPAEVAGDAATGRAVSRYFTSEFIQQQINALSAWLHTNVLVWANLAQFVVILLAAVAARFMAPRLRDWAVAVERRRSANRTVRRAAKVTAPLALPAL